MPYSKNYPTSRHHRRLLRIQAILVLVLLAVLFSTAWSEGPVSSEDGRFIDHGDGTITDTQTGLMWMKKDSYLDGGKWLNWFEAFEYVRQLNEEGFAMYHDWQMPTPKELVTLYEPGKFNSKQVGREMQIHIDSIFEKNGSGTIWSAEENGVHNAFGIVFNTGARFNSSKKSKARRAVRAVRYAGS